MAIIEHLITLVSTADAQLERIMWAWIRDVGIADVHAGV